jgi:hypothetical protein
MTITSATVRLPSVVTRASVVDRGFARDVTARGVRDAAHARSAIV